MRKNFQLKFVISQTFAKFLTIWQRKNTEFSVTFTRNRRLLVSGNHGNSDKKKSKNQNHFWRKNKIGIKLIFAGQDKKKGRSIK